MYSRAHANDTTIKTNLKEKLLNILIHLLNMTNFLSEQELAIAMAVVSTATMMMGFLLGFSLCYIEKELLLGEINELVDKAIEKKFERDEYVLQLEGLIAQLQHSESERVVLKRKRTMIEESSSEDEPATNIHVEFPPPPAGPIERCVARGVSDRSEKEPMKED